jgi:hypothetical protein
VVTSSSPLHAMAAAIRLNTIRLSSFELAAAATGRGTISELSVKLLSVFAVNRARFPKSTQI